MKVVGTIDVEPLTRFHPDQRAPLWWGILGLITVEATVVASFIVAYLYLAAYADAWPPADLAPPPLLWPTVNLALLLASCATMFWAGWGIRRGNKRILALGVSISAALAYGVLALRALEFMAFDFRWNEHAYGSAVWTLAGFHFTHVVATAVGTTVVAILAWRGYFTPKRQIGVVVDTMYWYFVAIVWIPLYITLFWVPRWYGG